MRFALNQICLQNLKISLCVNFDSKTTMYLWKQNKIVWLVFQALKWLFSIIYKQKGGKIKLNEIIENIVKA